MIHDIFVLLDDGDRGLLRSFELSTTQYAVLLLLDTGQGWRLTDLSERLRFDKSTMTRIIDRLEQASLVRRIADPADRRVQRVILTPQGQLRRDEARAAHERSIVHRMDVLNPDEQRQLCSLLAKLRCGLQRDLSPPEAPKTQALERG
jgi:DNA-binding MarR family transcriptional regulator